MNSPVVTGVSAALPLSLLESVREHDRPSEFLEDEDLMVSLPRRLGLTGVVDTQIRQYQAAGRRSVSLEELTSLIKLILRRDDAAQILRETGRRMAEQHYRNTAGVYTRMLRILPRRFMNRSWRRSVRRLLRQMAGEAHIDVAGTPPVVQLHPNPLAQLEPAGVACGLYGSSLERLAELYTGATPYSIETKCSSAGENHCEWTVSGI